jgi:hypothetical protein
MKRTDKEECASLTSSFYFVVPLRLFGPKAGQRHEGVAELAPYGVKVLK